MKIFEIACQQNIAEHIILPDCEKGRQGCIVNVMNRPFYSWVLSYLAMNASEAGGDLALIQRSEEHTSEL